jgi:hypothetical protein
MRIYVFFVFTNTFVGLQNALGWFFRVGVFVRYVCMYANPPLSLPSLVVVFIIIVVVVGGGGVCWCLLRWYTGSN